ncbi:MAG: phosphate ABC transporter permease subunit PstC [Armatimonadetes bacterium]|nr:phosphate ABC transporter permease subunit PstC [Armatimonadota bacterium]MDW8029418.1 phosphate ABC transporter permease subunit PstC [Armatimonadota bacterium]
METKRITRWVHWQEKFVVVLLFAFASVSVVITLAIAISLGVEAIGFFREVPIWRFLTEKEWTPLFSIKKFGILPLVCGTFLVAGIAMIIAIPIGILMATYLAEHSSERVRRLLKPTIEILAGIPSVLYGYFALLFVTPLLQKFIPNLTGFNALSPGIVLAFMVLPTITSLSEDIIYAVPQSIREASLALGATKLQTTFRAVLPAASSGIVAACLLGFSRAIGETMLVTIAAGQMPNLTINPLEPIQTMTAYIVQVSLGDVPHGSLEYRTIFAVGLALFLMTLAFNLLGLFLRERFVRTFQRLG